MFCTHVQFFHFLRPLNCRPVNLDTCQPVYLSSCRSVTCNMAIYGVCILLRGSGGLPLKHFVVIQCLLHCTHAHFFHFCRPLNCRPVNLDTCQHVNLSTCQPVYLSTCRSVNILLVILVDITPHPVTMLYMEYAFCCWEYEGHAPNAFRCESMPTPLNLTYNL